MINMLDMIIRQARTLNEEVFDIGIKARQNLPDRKDNRSACPKGVDSAFRISISRLAGSMIMSIVLKK
jgi:hypothetical protein